MSLIFDTKKVACYVCLSIGKRVCDLQPSTMLRCSVSCANENGLANILLEAFKKQRVIPGSGPAIAKEFTKSVAHIPITIEQLHFFTVSLKKINGLIVVET